MGAKLRDFYFTIDLRSLALYRVFLALLLIYDVCERWRDAAVFYTAGGVLPRASANVFHWSLFDALHDLTSVRIVFALALVSHVSLLLGYRTRIAQCVSFLYLVNARNRNPLLSTGADAALVSMALWTLFLPLGAVWSLDARRRGAATGRSCAPSLAAFA